MKTRAMFARVIITALTFFLAVSQTAIASDEEEIIELADNFLQSFETGGIESQSKFFERGVSK